MIEKTEFTLDGEPKVEGGYYGNGAAGKIVIFSHGFGVKRGSRTLFKDLAERLKEKSLVCLFDYVEIDSVGSITVPPFTKQAMKLKKVLEFVDGKLRSKRKIIVAHSQGCLVVGCLSPKNINKVILVAPPIRPPAQRVEEYFRKRPETVIDLKGVSKIKRSDGTYTYVPVDYWPEAKSVDGLELYTKLAAKTELHFIRALDDQMIVGENYAPIKNNGKINYLELKGSHDFEDEARLPWLDKMVEIIER